MTPRLYSWGPRALYIGPALNLSAHRNAVAVLGVGIDAPFDVADDPRDATRGQRRCRSVLIPPATLHHFTGTAGQMAFLYLDATSPELTHLSARVRHPTERAGFDLVNERRVVDILRSLAADPASWSSARSALQEALGFPARNLDPRIRAALRRLHAESGVRLSLSDLAREAELSDSRFLHLFKSEAGVSLRRYKIWCGVGTALRAVGRGATLTVAALEGGFSSSAHFSTAFRQMFGLQPSSLARAGFAIHREQGGTDHSAPHRPAAYDSSVADS